MQGFIWLTVSWWRGSAKGNSVTSSSGAVICRKSTCFGLDGWKRDLQRDKDSSTSCCQISSCLCRASSGENKMQTSTKIDTLVYKHVLFPSLKTFHAVFQEKLNIAENHFILVAVLWSSDTKTDSLASFYVLSLGTCLYQSSKTTNFSKYKTPCIILSCDTVWAKEEL